MSRRRVDWDRPRRDEIKAMFSKANALRKELQDRDLAEDLEGVEDLERVVEEYERRNGR